MEPVGGDQFSQQRPLRSGINGNVRATEFRSIQSIAGGLRDRNIAGNDGNSGDAHRLGTKGHDQRHRVVGGRVGVNEKCSSHASCTAIEAFDREFALLSVNPLRSRIQKKLSGIWRTLLGTGALFSPSTKGITCADNAGFPCLLTEPVQWYEEVK